MIRNAVTVKSTIKMAFHTLEISKTTIAMALDSSSKTAK
jgi:hypothetical protein